MDEVRRIRNNSFFRILTHGREIGCFGPDHDYRKLNIRDSVTGLHDLQHMEEGVVITVRSTIINMYNSRHTIDFLEHVRYVSLHVPRKVSFPTVSHDPFK